MDIRICASRSPAFAVCDHRGYDVRVTDPRFLPTPKEQIIEQDFTGSISGFDFPTDFDPSILANQLDFGAGYPVSSRERRAQYLTAHGREDEAFERDE
jgi:hypothetical protein